MFYIGVDSHLFRGNDASGTGRFINFFGGESLKVELVQLLLVMGFELLPNLVMCGTGSGEFRLLCVPFFFKFMHKVLSATDSFIYLCLSIADEVNVG